VPALTFKKYLSAFNSIKGLLASVSILVPGGAYFTKYAPPFGELALLTASFATATVFITYYYTPSQPIKSKQELPPLIKIAIKVLIISVVLLILYLVLIDLCTVQIPGTSKRIQIGFDKFDWSLTEYGKKVKAQDPTASPQDWLSEESFKTGVAKLFWQTWSIFLSGISMIVIFISAFVLWSFGWSLIAKQKAIGGT
jgi:hypothetical protein